MKSILMLAAVSSAFLFNSCSNDSDEATNDDAKKVLVISAIPDEKVSDQEIKFPALADYLAKELGIEVKFTTSAKYSAAVERFKNGEVQLAWFGGLTGVQAQQAVPGARAIAQGDVDPNYVSYFIANSSTGIQPSDKFPAEAIKDLSFTFGSKSSTSGRLMPTYFIIKETGKTPEEFFSKPVQFRSSGSHYATAKAVEAGSVQVGAMSYKKYDSMVASGELDPTKAVKIWTTPGYVDYNLTAHPAIDEMFGEGTIDKLQKALVECDDPAVLKAFNRKKLIPAKNEDFQSILDIAKEVGLMR